MQHWYQCPYCGNNVAYGQPGCSRCGNKLQWQQPQPPPQPVQPSHYQSTPQYQQQYQKPDQAPQQFQQHPPRFPQEPEKPKSNTGKIVFGIIAGGLLLCIGSCAICINSGSKSSTSNPSQTPTTSSPNVPKTPTAQAIQVSAGALYKAYEANQVAADVQYEGKILLVTGVVSSIGKDILSNPYVVIGDGGKYSLVGVQCFFDKGAESELAKLSKGQTVTIQGKQSGYFMNVTLSGCSLK